MMRLMMTYIDVLEIQADIETEEDPHGVRMSGRRGVSVMTPDLIPPNVIKRVFAVFSSKRHQNDI
jgi:hypothetical protein